MIILLIGVYQFSMFNYNHADMHWYQIIELVLHACYISLRKFQFIAQKGQGRYMRSFHDCPDSHNTKMINHDFSLRGLFKIAIQKIAHNGGRYFIQMHFYSRI